jgi:hypothetical protein
MKRYLSLAAALLLTLTLAAQSTPEEFSARYDRLVARVGIGGAGVETLLDRWEEAYPNDLAMLAGKFACYLEKSATPKVIRLAQDRYLGREPLLAGKDSAGVKANYFEDTEYDDELFGRSQSALDKAISLAPLRLDYRLAKVSSLTAYEKESPDMAMQTLRGIIDYNYSSRPEWVYPGLAKVDGDAFNALIQEHCYNFFRIGSPQSQEAFRELSELMLSHNPGEPLFLDNLGSYWLVSRGDGKKALKYYNKVLKKHPDDLTAIRNSLLVARRDKDVKLEKKYLEMLVKYADSESDRLSAKARLDALNAKK